VRGAIPHGENGFGGALVRAEGPDGMAGPSGLPVIPSPRQGRHDDVRGALADGSITYGAPTQFALIMTRAPDSVSVQVISCRFRPVTQSFVPVTQIRRKSVPEGADVSCKPQRVLNVEQAGSHDRAARAIAFVDEAITIEQRLDYQRATLLLKAEGSDLRRGPSGRTATPEPCDEPHRL
jgi:hypothetical protein